MLKLYFIRHGETLSNTWHTLQGWSDTPLTKKGIEQGIHLGKGLQHIPFQRIYTSTSERAYDTACYACQNKYIPIMCKGLKEMNFGLLETKSNTFDGCETYMERIMYPYDQHGGESLEQVCLRVKQTMQMLIDENKHLGGNIMCVTHGIAMLGCIRFVDENVYQECIRDEIRFGNCCVTVISYNQGVLQIDAINDMQYVEKGAML